MKSYSQPEQYDRSPPSQNSNYSFASAGTSKELCSHEEALQALCKQILKSRFFKGYYRERRYVEAVDGYRDIVSLQNGEHDLEKLLLDVRAKLQLFYQQKNDMWIGVTKGKIRGSSIQSGPLETCIWTELDDLAFGEYWFTIKTVRFREGEILLKLKKVRSVKSSALTTVPHVAQTATRALMKRINTPMSENDVDGDVHLGLDDFLNIVNFWMASIKHTVYDFMSNDISKENLKAFLNFAGLLIITVLSGLVVGIKYLGVFALRLIYELSRLTHVLAPVLTKVIEVFQKIVVGFYVLLAMIWKDTMVKHERRNPSVQFRTLEYNRPLYKSIQYNARETLRNELSRANSNF